MSADFTPEKRNYKILPPFKMQVLTNFPYIEADFDALTNYQLLCKVVEYLNMVIHNENELTEEVEGLYNAYVSLQNYVNNYFDNLDVQDEINNKLDEMAESGQLTDIIAQYLGLAGMITFNNVAEMKTAQNLVNGSKCCTLGYHNTNDGGNALYKIRTITNDDVIDESTIIALNDNTLIGELIINNLNVKQLGCYGDNIHDDTLKLQLAFNLNRDLYINEGVYLISNSLSFSGQANLTFNKNAIIKANSSLNSLIIFNNELNADISQNCNILNMHIDGDDKVETGMILSNYVNLYFENLQIDNCTKIGLLTKGTNSRQQAEVRITKSCIRNYNYAYANSIGIKIDSTDGSYSDSSIVDFETAIQINNSGNAFNNLHPWIHFTKLWNNSIAYALPSNGGDLTQINGGFIDSIRTSFVCNTGQLNASNISIYYANNLYNDKSESETITPIATYIVGYPARVFYGSNSTQLRISNIFAYIQEGSTNSIANFSNSDNSISNCIFNPSTRWIGKILDYSRNKTANITDSENITSTYKYCTKVGRLVNVQYRGSLNNDVVGYVTLATLPFRPVQEVFFVDGQGKKMYITNTGELQAAENLQSGYNTRFSITYVGTLAEN